MATLNPKLDKVEGLEHIAKQEDSCDTSTAPEPRTLTVSSSPAEGLAGGANKRHPI